jgi:hypothetical protein
MKQWRPLVAGLALVLGGVLPAHATLFSVTDGLAGDGPQIKTYMFDITIPATYLASLADLAFPGAFQSLSLGLAQTGGSTLLGSTTGTGSFEFVASNPGSYSLLLVGDPGPSDAGFFSINVDATGAPNADPTPVPEPAAWLMMAAGAILLGFVRLRAARIG